MLGMLGAAARRGCGWLVSVACLSAADAGIHSRFAWLFYPSAVLVHPDHQFPIPGTLD
jgi:hypothetical protein